MAKTRAEKKRKVSSEAGNAVSVKAEADEDAAAPVAPPGLSNRSPIEKILQVDLWRDDSNTVQSALFQLACIMCSNSNEAFEENRATVHRLGGAAILPGVLRKWYGFPVIQALGCRAINNASSDNAAFKKSMKDSGGLDAIIWALQSYPDNLQVQYGCGALRNAIYGVKENAEYVVKTLNQGLNGVDCIIAAMKKFPHDAQLQRYACGALYVLTEWDEFKDAVKSWRSPCSFRSDREPPGREQGACGETSDESEPCIEGFAAVNSATTQYQNQPAAKLVPPYTYAISKSQIQIVLWSEKRTLDDCARSYNIILHSIVMLGRLLFVRSLPRAHG